MPKTTMRRYAINAVVSLLHDYSMAAWRLGEEVTLQTIRDAAQERNPYGWTWDGDVSIDGTRCRRYENVVLDDGELTAAISAAANLFEVATDISLTTSRPTSATGRGCGDPGPVEDV